MQWVGTIATVLLCLLGVVYPILYYAQSNQAVVALANVQNLQTVLAQRTAELNQIKQAITEFNAQQQAAREAQRAAPPDTTTGE
jgi:Tfp pilus assembly protein PilN